MPSSSQLNTAKTSQPSRNNRTSPTGTEQSRARHVSAG